MYIAWLTFDSSHCRAYGALRGVWQSHPYIMQLCWTTYDWAYWDVVSPPFVSPFSFFFKKVNRESLRFHGVQSPDFRTEKTRDLDDAKTDMNCFHYFRPTLRELFFIAIAIAFPLSQVIVLHSINESTGDRPLRISTRVYSSRPCINCCTECTRNDSWGVWRLSFLIFDIDLSWVQWIRLQIITHQWHETRFRSKNWHKACHLNYVCLLHDFLGHDKRNLRSRSTAGENYSWR